MSTETKTCNRGDSPHPFVPGVSEDDPTPDPRWCNTCGESQPTTAPHVPIFYVYDDARIEVRASKNPSAVMSIYVTTADRTALFDLYLTPDAARQLVRKVGDAFIRQAIKTGTRA